jgi:hypothetical protein
MIKNCIGNPLKKTVIVLIGFALLLCTFFAVYSHRYLYGDGAKFVYWISTGIDVDFYLRNPRAIGYFLTQFLPFLVNKLGLYSYQILNAAATLNAYFLPLLLWIIALYLVRKTQVRFYIFFVVFLFVFFWSNVFLMGAQHVLHGLIAVSFALLLQARPLRIPEKLILIVLMLLQVRVYEAAFMFAPLYAILILYRIKNDGGAIRDKCLLCADLGGAIFLFGYDLWNYFYYKQQGTGPKLSNLSEWVNNVLNNVLGNAMFYILGLVCLYGIIRIIRQRFLTDKPLFNIVAGIILLFIPLFVLYMWFKTGVFRVFGIWQPIWSSHLPGVAVNSRFFVPFSLFAVSCALTADFVFRKKCFLNRCKIRNIDYLLLVCLAFVITANDIQTSINHRAYIHRVYDVVNHNEGIINTDDVLVDNVMDWGYGYSYAWGWTFPLMSTILSDKDTSAMLSWVKLREHERKYGIVILKPPKLDVKRPQYPEMTSYVNNYYWSRKKDSVR